MKKLDEGNHFNRHANLLFTFFLQPEYLTLVRNSRLPQNEKCVKMKSCAQLQQ